MKRETRVLTGARPVIETRADGSKAFSGDGIVFGEWSQPLGGFFREKILRSAVDGADMSDIIVKFNHDINWTLGRTSSGTASYELTDAVCKYNCPYDATDPDHQRAMAKVQRGDCKGSSFEFTVAEGGDIWEKDPMSDTYLRTITKIEKIYDFAPVINPAYLQTSVGMTKRDAESIMEARGMCVKIEIEVKEEDDAPEGDTGMPEDDGYKPKLMRGAENNTNTDAIASPSVEAELDLLAMEIEL